MKTKDELIEALNDAAAAEHKEEFEERCKFIDALEFRDHKGEGWEGHLIMKKVTKEEAREMYPDNRNEQMKEVIHEDHTYFIGAPYISENGIPCILGEINDNDFPFTCHSARGVSYSRTLTPCEPVPITKVKTAGEVVWDALGKDVGEWSWAGDHVKNQFEMAAEKLGIKAL